MHNLYFLINFFTILVPFVFSFHKKINFHKQFKAFIIADVMIAIPFLIWDFIFTKHGIWGFNSYYISGIYIANLPIEEVLFFICIPFSCVFTYYCLSTFFKLKMSAVLQKSISVVFIILLLSIGLFNLQKLYTSITFISLSAILYYLQFINQAKWLPKIYFIYPILLIPFLIVNGILTGTGLQNPVVWYHNAYNLGIRILTIPIEDVFYGFELIILVLYVYHQLKLKFSTT